MTAKVWDAKSGKETLTLLGHESAVTAVAFSVDGKRIVTGSLDRTVRVWDAITGKETHTLKGHSKRVTSVAISPDCSRIITVGDDQMLKIWGRATTKAEILPNPVGPNP